MLFNGQTINREDLPVSDYLRENPRHLFQRYQDISMSKLNQQPLGPIQMNMQTTETTPDAWAQLDNRSK